MQITYKILYKFSLIGPKCNNPNRNDVDDVNAHTAHTATAKEREANTVPTAYLHTTHDEIIDSDALVCALFDHLVIRIRTIELSLHFEGLNDNLIFTYVRFAFLFVVALALRPVLALASSSILLILNEFWYLIRFIAFSAKISVSFLFQFFTPFHCVSRLLQNIKAIILSLVKCWNVWRECSLHWWRGSHVVVNGAESDRGSLLTSCRFVLGFSFFIFRFCQSLAFVHILKTDWFQWMCMRAVQRAAHGGKCWNCKMAANGMWPPSHPVL